ncbi:MAG: hypothetical protein VKO21_05120 [Candidatus Sericytochromatia bacterium]|nr:hypothetical protein [Candidatus Sericytochromatia bacterium]
MLLLPLFAGPLTASADVPVPRTSLPYVSAVKAPEKVRSGDAALVKIEGSWPDPSWSLGGVRIRKEGRKVFVALEGKPRRDGFFPMVLVPFVATASLPVLPAGLWTVVAPGRTEDATCSLRVLSGH